MHLLVPCQGSGSPFMGENGSCLCVMDIKLLSVKRPLHCVSVNVCAHAGLHLFAFGRARTSTLCVYTCEISLNASVYTHWW